MICMFKPLNRDTLSCWAKHAKHGLSWGREIIFKSLSTVYSRLRLPRIATIRYRHQWIRLTHAHSMCMTHRDAAEPRPLRTEFGEHDRASAGTTTKQAQASRQDTFIFGVRCAGKDGRFIEHRDTREPNVDLFVRIRTPPAHRASGREWTTSC